MTGCEKRGMGGKRGIRGVEGMLNVERGRNGMFGVCRNGKKNSESRRNGRM